MTSANEEYKITDFKVVTCGNDAGNIKFDYLASQHKPKNLRAFIAVKKSQEILDGKVNLSRLLYRTYAASGKVYKSLYEALSNLNEADEVVMEFEFLQDQELIDAVNAAISSRFQVDYNVKWIASYTKKSL